MHWKLNNGLILQWGLYRAGDYGITTIQLSLSYTITNYVVGILPITYVDTDFTSTKTIVFEMAFNMTACYGLNKTISSFQCGNWLNKYWIALGY